MEQRVCFGCMRLTTSPVCEHCGFDGSRRNEPHQLPMGTVLMGKYVVGRVLGQGGFGITYLGWNRYLQTRVAIKEYFPSNVVNRNATVNTSVFCKSQQLEKYFQDNRYRFMREAQTLARLQKVPQIVSIYDFFELNNTAYIVMEYLEGEDLRSHMVRKGKLPAKETFGLLKPVMEALSRVHEAGLVHRDISPDNIMLMADGRVKLMDFGAVRHVNHPDAQKALTQGTQAIVKEGFAPLEQYSEKGSLGPWTDEYALCATVYYCLTGRVPESAPTRVLGEGTLDWNKVPGLTAQQRQVLAKGMAIQAKDRYPSIRELMDALFGHKEPPKPPEKPPVKPSGPVFDPPQTIYPKQPPKGGTGAPGGKPEAGGATGNGGSGKPAAPRPSRKKYFVIAAAVAVLALIVLLLIPSGWKEMEDGSMAYYSFGKKTVGWLDKDEHRYYFDSEGKMVTGSRKIGGDTYFFDEDGVMERNTLREIARETYYFTSDGTMAKNELCKVAGNIHYFGGNGIMVKNRFQTVSGKTYYFDDVGQAMEDTLLTVSGRDYYFDAEGVMATGWREVQGLDYYFSPAGPGINTDVRAGYGYTSKHSGGWNDDKQSLGGTNTYSWVFDKRVTNCVKLTMNFQITKLTKGSVFGDWHLYGKDLSGEWVKLGNFQVKDTREVVWSFRFEKPVSFTELAAVYAQAKTAGDFEYSKTLSFKDFYQVDPEDMIAR